MNIYSAWMGLRPEQHNAEIHSPRCVRCFGPKIKREIEEEDDAPYSVLCDACEDACRRDYAGTLT